MFFTYENKLIRFESNWENTSEYDNLPLYFNEEQLIHCLFKNNRSLYSNFYNYDFGSYWYNKIKDKNIKLINKNFKEYIYSEIKSCNNFRCTLAKMYQFLKLKVLLILVQDKDYSLYPH